VTNRDELLPVRDDLQRIDGHDWGRRSVRWTGVRSRVVSVSGRRGHLMRIEAEPGVPPGASVHLLIAPMGMGGWSWIDVMRPLAAFGPVVAPDLPGSGWTRPRRGATDAEGSARFVSDLMEALGLERAVVHGYSGGALVALLLADLAPARVERLVLVAPPIAAVPETGVRRRRWQLLGRLALWVAPPVLRLIARASIRAMAAVWRRWREDPSDPGLARIIGRVGGDPRRISPEMIDLVLDELDGFRAFPWRSDSGVMGWISAARAMTVGQRAVGEAVDRVSVPTLLVWGDQDRVIPRVIMDDLVARRPDWSLHVLESVGHLPPWEVPDVYAAAVGRWLSVTGKGAR